MIRVILLLACFLLTSCGTAGSGPTLWGDIKESFDPRIKRERLSPEEYYELSMEGVPHGRHIFVPNSIKYRDAYRLMEDIDPNKAIVYRSGNIGRLKWNWGITAYDTNDDWKRYQKIDPFTRKFRPYRNQREYLEDD